MDIRLLGALEVLDDGGAAVAVSGAKLRSLLACLAIRPGQVVSSDRLVEDLWGAYPPATATNSLQVLVSKLRRALPEGAVSTRAPGYALDVHPEEVDAGRMSRLAAEGRKALAAGDLEHAAHALSEALALWRGEALAEFAYEEFAQAEIARLAEERAAILEDRVEADLACGRHVELVSELEAAVAAEPLRERRRAQLMLALYRSGRQADALRQFQDARRILGEELGLEPGPELRRFEAAMLAHDPALDLPTSRIGPPPREPGNLRGRADRFVGRDTDLEQIRGALENTALVTLIGPGGVGKTRLAVEAASGLRDRHPDGVWMVELASVLDPAGVCSAVAGVLRAEAVGGERTMSTEDRIVEHVRERSMLIVLDNCEHVIGPAAALTELLVSAAPRLRLIATSREALAIPGEVLLPVAGLAPSAALELFTDRAISARSDFSADEPTVRFAEEICARLDGLPLAIELAAARLRALPVGVLVDRLDDRFRLLTGGARTALPRHQTLRAVVDWSYDLLFEDERRLFARLSVFTGGCDLEAAEAICTDDELPRNELVEVLGRLIDKSLVTADLASPNSARYSQLQTLWQYGRERLADSGEAAAVRDRHARWYLEFADQARTGLRGADAADWRARVEADLANLRSALEWFIEQDDATSALTLTASVSWLGFVRADSAVAARWLGEALALPGPAHPGLHGLASAWHALHTANLIGPAPVLDESLRAVDELRHAREPALLAEGLVLLSEIYNRLADFPAALDVLAEARTLLVEGRDDWHIAAHDIMAAGNLSALGRLEEAERLAQTAVDRYKAIGERWFIIEGLGLLAGMREARGDLTEAAADYEELIATAGRVGITHYQVLWMMRLGAIRARLGDNTSAEELFAAAVAASRRPTYTGTALIGRAAAARRLGDFDSCQKWLIEAMAIYEGIDFTPGICAALIGFGWSALLNGDLSAAHTYAQQAIDNSAQGTDAVLRLSAETLVVAIELTESDCDANRARFNTMLEERSAASAARFARILGGAFGATFDEPDVTAVAAAHDLSDRSAV